MNISIATIEDVHALVILVNSAYRGEHSKQGWTSEAELLDGLRTDADSLTKMINKENAVILKCCNDDNILEGCVYLENKDITLYLGMLTVSPRLQSLGIGKHLLHAAEKYAFTHNCYIVEMTVISIRHELIKWYEKHGYKKTGAIKPFPDDVKFGIPKQPLQFIVMAKNLEITQNDNRKM